MTQKKLYDLLIEAKDDYYTARNYAKYAKKKEKEQYERQ